MSNQYGRATNKEKTTYYIYDSEQTMMYRPQDYTGNKFFGVWSRVAALGTILNYEDKEKYLDKFNYKIKADLERKERDLYIIQIKHSK